MAEEEAAKMAEEAFAEAEMGDDTAGEGTFFESVKTSLPGLGKTCFLYPYPVFFRHLVRHWGGVDNAG